MLVMCYVQICSQLSDRLERQQKAHREEVSQFQVRMVLCDRSVFYVLHHACKSCRHSVWFNLPLCFSALNS